MRAAIGATPEAEKDHDHETTGETHHNCVQCHMNRSTQVWQREQRSCKHHHWQRKQTIHWTLGRGTTAKKVPGERRAGNDQEAVMGGRSIACSCRPDRFVTARKARSG